MSVKSLIAKVMFFRVEENRIRGQKIVQFHKMGAEYVAYNDKQMSQIAKIS